MASLSFLATTTTTSFPLHHPPKSSSTAPRRRFYTCCKTRESSSKNTANTTDTTDNSKREKPESGSVLRLDRRNVLLGLGGLYGASTLTGRGNMAVGAPISPPDLSKCHLADGGDGVGKVQCCPPYGSDTPIVDYQFPSSLKPLRVRRPAHLLEKEEIEKYKEAITKMRELTKTDPNDPRGWMQQANVHCQFCNGAFDQVGFDSALLQFTSAGSSCHGTDGTSISMRESSEASLATTPSLSPSGTGTPQMGCACPASSRTPHRHSTMRIGI
ncbi:hypothetical protein AAC387_Pa04g1835 [Persea americana]